MTIQAFEWYRVKDSRQYCQVTGIASTADPDIQVPAAREGLKGFHVYLLWFAPSGESPAAWTKRAILMEIGKALALLREPTAADAPLIEMLKTTGRNLPLVSMGVDGEKTVPI